MENQQYRFVCFKVESKDNKFNVSEKYKKFNDNDVAIIDKKIAEHDEDLDYFKSLAESN